MKQFYIHHYGFWQTIQTHVYQFSSWTWFYGATFSKLMGWTEHKCWGQHFTRRQLFWLESISFDSPLPIFELNWIALHWIELDLRIRSWVGSWGWRVRLTAQVPGLMRWAEQVSTCIMGSLVGWLAIVKCNSIYLWRTSHPTWPLFISSS